MPGRDNVVHGDRLKRQFSAAYARARASIAERRALQGHRSPGVYLEVTGSRARPSGDLSWERKGIRLGALRVDENHVQTAAIFVPEGAETFVSDRLQRYAARVEVGERAVSFR